MDDHESFSRTDGYNGTNPTDDGDEESTSTEDMVEVIGIRKVAARKRPAESSSSESESDDDTSLPPPLWDRDGSGRSSSESEPDDDGFPNVDDSDDEDDDDRPPPPLVKHNITQVGFEMTDSEDEDEDEEELIVSPTVASVGAAAINFDFEAVEDEERRKSINIFDDDRFYVRKMCKPCGSTGWQCQHCMCFYSGGYNSTKALAHISHSKMTGIKPCTGFIEADTMLLYQKVQSIRTNKRNHKATSRATIKAKVDDDHTSGLDALSALPGKKQTQIKKQQKKLSATISEFHKSALIGARYNHSIGSGGKSHPWMPSTKKSFAAPTSFVSPIDLQSKLFVSSPNPSAGLALDQAIGDFIASNALTFGLGEDPKFRKVIKLAKHVSSNYVPPSRKEVGGKLLKSNYDQLRKKEDTLLLKDANLFGLQAYGDAATITKTPYVNLLASSPNNTTCCLEIHDCTEHMASGGIKDAEYIAGLFQGHMERLDPEDQYFDMMTFDGGSNFQKAATALAALNPKIEATQAAEHVLALLFKDLSCEHLVKHLKKFYSVLYRWFGGSHHAPYATFTKYCQLHNSSRRVGLIRPADTRMAGYIRAFL